MPRFRRGLWPLSLAAAYAVTAAVWLAVAGGEPSGRWVAIHLVTLGVLTNLVAGLMPIFAATFLHTADTNGWVYAAHLVMRNLAVVLALIGLPRDMPALVGIGAALLVVDVLVLYIELRQLRRRALPNRFTYVVRTYERACAAFLHGSVLAGLLGSGAITGAWYGSGRVAHLQLMLLGWGGLTLLATLVPFGPAMMRVPIAEGADAVASRALRRANLALTVASSAMLLTALDGWPHIVARAVATLGLAGYFLAALQVIRPVIRAGRRRVLGGVVANITALGGWFLLGVYLLALSAETRWAGVLDAAELALGVGGLFQAMLATVAYLLPSLLGTDAADRTRRHDAAAVLGRTRPLAFNVGLGLLVASALSHHSFGAASSAQVNAGWVLVAGASVTTVLLAILGRTPSRRGREP